MTWIYKQTEPTLWTVGHMEGERFAPESDHGTPDEAARRVHYLNGGIYPWCGRLHEGMCCNQPLGHEGEHKEWASGSRVRGAWAD